MIKKTFSYFLMLFMLVAITACSNDDEIFGSAPNSSLISNGTVSVITDGNVRYHVVELPDGYTSTLVESTTGVVLVDTGNGTGTGAELRAYADAIAKPISIIITHPHGDHYENIANFNDANIRVYAQSSVAAALMADSGFTGLYSVATITGVSSSQTISGLDFQFASVANAEAAENGFVSLPTAKVVFPGDLVYDQEHSYLREYTPLDNVDEISNWLAGLAMLKNDFSDAKYIFVGHGGYRDDVITVIDENIDYLTKAQGLIKGTRNLTAGGAAKSVLEVSDELELLFPDYAIGGLRLSKPGAFGPNDPGATWF